MKNAKRENLLGLGALSMLFVVANLVMIAPDIAAAKSLYLIANIQQETTGATQPLHVYDIGADGLLTFQVERDIQYIMLGAVGIAIDSDAGYLFITYEDSGDILTLDTITMKDASRITAPEAVDLAGIVYDHRKGLLYCVDRGKDRLYVYNWDPKVRELLPVPKSPFFLRKSTAYGIALDELSGLLYVANATNTVNVYDTSDWDLVNTISLDHIAISIAIDGINGLVYTGAGYAGDFYLTQYHLTTGKQTKIRVEPDAGVIGLAVDPDTSLIYMSTGQNNKDGGDNLLVYDAALNLVEAIPIDGNPTGLAITGKARRPLNLTKSIDGNAPGEVGLIGRDDIVTYTICFDNNDGDFDATDILLTDLLPAEVDFVSADDSVFGWYDPATHSYTWSLPDLQPGLAVCLGLVVHVKQDTPLGTIVSNSAIISSNETATSMVVLDAITIERPLEVQSILVSPDRIRRTGSSEDIQAIMILPPGIGKDDVEDVLPVLSPGNVRAIRQVVFGTATRAKVIAIFDKAEIVNAIPDYGQVMFKVVGKGRPRRRG
ncbi:MAG: hypothetical protein ACYTE3_26575 [Planctomycetota bacterium]|jgi:uncharacterized repeat protein (TIGR01451 family)